MRVPLIINIDKFLCDFLLALIIIYSSQYLIGVQGIIGPPVLVLIVIISFYYLLKYGLRQINGNVFILFWLFFLLYNLVCYLFSRNITQTDEIKHILINMLPFFAFYHFSEKSILTERKLKVFFGFLLVSFCMSFFLKADELAASTGKEYFTNNMSYLILGLLPFVFIFRRGAITLSLILLLTWYAVQSSKRAALLVCFMAMCVFLYRFISASKGIRKIYGVTLIVVFAIAFIYLIQSYYSYVGLDQRFEKRLLGMIYDGDTSHRDTIFNQLYDAWINSKNIFVYLFGLGYGSSAEIVGITTHNDLIKALGENGLIGLVLFLGVLLSLFGYWFREFIRPGYRLAYAMFLCTLLAGVLASRWYGASFFYLNCVFLPYILSSTVKRRKHS